MGNVPISCCRSKSPRLQQVSSNRSNNRLGSKSPYSTSDHNHSHEGKFSNKIRRGDDNESVNQPSHILQHISEREPDDSETDPSSNPLDRPIFATRSSHTRNKTNSYNDSYSSNYSTSRKQNDTPLMSSQDYGYNSTTSTNLTHYDGQLNDSFDSSIQRQEKLLKDREELISNDNHNFSDNRLMLVNSPTSSEGIDQFLPFVTRCENGFVDRKAEFDKNILLKSSSCSTIFVDGSTISQPNLKQTIKCLSLAIYYHIKNRTSDNSVDIFDETIHPLKMPSSTNLNSQDELIILDQSNNTCLKLNEPDEKVIHSFVRTLFKSAQLTSEYAITSLVYLERLMTYAEMDLTPVTWRRMFLGAILLSSKVWEDQAVWNVDYAQILEEISVDDINELERQFLELIQFNMNVPSSVYAKYYFHLRTLALKNGLSLGRTLLTVEDAKTLEVSFVSSILINLNF